VQDITEFTVKPAESVLSAS